MTATAAFCRRRSAITTCVHGVGGGVIAAGGSDVRWVESAITSGETTASGHLSPLTPALSASEIAVRTPKRRLILHAWPGATEKETAGAEG